MAVMCTSVVALLVQASVWPKVGAAKDTYQHIVLVGTSELHAYFRRGARGSVLRRGRRSEVRQRKWPRASQLPAPCIVCRLVILYTTAESKLTQSPDLPHLLSLITRFPRTPFISAHAYCVGPALDSMCTIVPPHQNVSWLAPLP